MSDNRIIIALIIGLILLIGLIVKTKIHTFLALIISALFIGIAGGMPYENVIKSVTDGFGGTLGSIGIIIGFGVMMGQLFEISNAAKRMALTFIKIFGKGREDLAMAITGFLVSIPIYCDSGFVILFPVAKALSKNTRKSIITLGLALASGLVITHTLVPPTPGPVGAAGIFEANVGAVILWGIVIAIPMVIATLLYARFYGKKIYQIPDEEGNWIRPEKSSLADINDYTIEDNEKMPSTLIAFLPIIIPIILILINTILSTISKVSGLEIKGIYSALSFLGTPIVAVGIGLIIAIITLTKGMSRDKVIKELEVGIQSAGIIILVTGGGGALGKVLTESGVGADIANSISKMNINPLLLPFIISTLIRFIQGSGTVAMLTSASISAPIVLPLGVNPVFATLSACVGSLFFSYFNDSFFWVVNRSLGLTDAKEQIKGYSIISTIAWAVGFVTIVLLNLIFG
ncbi:GntP family permease [Anaerococcus porci]|uniref:GntP family permease n=1 Tax=Anaerococcus porci TaxID=2652269 RepID=A0A6N7VED7_9FIRM|nr:gluconate:H+ symporter [Anaerococcus porci]MDY3006855.1 gluconate:H+ symporter [Anaerococcus porci]MSS77818.1 GntP family permease [Anaerococcus porci]